MIYNSIVMTLGCALALTYATPQPARPGSIGEWTVDCLQNRFHQCFARREALSVVPPGGVPEVMMVTASRMGEDFYLLFTTPRVTHSVLTVVTDDGRVEKFVKTGCSAHSCFFGGLFEGRFGERIMKSQTLYVGGDFEGHPGAEMMVDLTGLRAAVYALR